MVVRYSARARIRVEMNLLLSDFTVGGWRRGALLNLHTIGHHLAALLLETHLFVALPAGVGLLLNQELLKGEELHLLSIHDQTQNGYIIHTP